MKRIILIILLLSSVIFLPTVSALADEDNIFSEEKDQLVEALPDESRELLKKYGINIDGIDSQSITAITPNEVFKLIMGVTEEKIKAPFKALMSIIVVTILVCLLDGMKSAIEKRIAAETFNAVSTLCLCAILLTPLIELINNTKSVITTTGDFMMIFIPIFAGVMLAGGQTVSVGSYQLIALSAAQLVNKIVNTFILPFMTIHISFSVASSASGNRLRLNEIGKMLKSIAVWLLVIITTVYCGLLSVQGIVGTAADSTAARTARFLISSSVPAIGSALGDALTSVQSGIKLLKSCVGVFGAIVPIVIMAPTIIEVILWHLTLKLGAGISKLVDSNPITSLLDSFAEMIGLLISITLVILLTLTITTVIMLMLGNVT